VRWFRRHYGAGPVHLLGLLACFAISAYAATRVIDQGEWKRIAFWFVGCLVVHDLIGWPVYTLADRAVIRVQERHATLRSPAVPWVNHVRVPTIISAVLFAMFFPLIFRLSNVSYTILTGFSENAYLTNWLAVTGVLFAGSGAIFLLRLGLARRRLARVGGPTAGQPSEGAAGS